MVCYIDPVFPACTNEDSMEWGNLAKPVDSSKGSLFSNTKGIVIAKTDISSPDGLDRILKLELLEKDKTDKDSYTGTFALRMYDDFDNRIASLSMKDIFGTGGSYAFPKDMNLFVLEITMVMVRRKQF